MNQSSIASVETPSTLAKATFAAGCFWGVEATFRQLTGVVDSSVGYMGGTWANPSYLDVLSRVTGHAEVAQVLYNPAAISYEQLLTVFWSIHDPTSLNRQGADRGEQYRSAIFCHTPTQFELAGQSKTQLDRSGNYDRPIVTEITMASAYYLATDDHQQYFEKQGIKRPTQQPSP